MNPLQELPVTERLQQMDRDRVIERIWRKDHTVWKDDPTEITNRLGWLTVSDLMHERIGELVAFADQAAADGFETAVLLGMGGSSLAPEVFMRTFGAADGALELIVLDTTHPATIERVAGQLELGTTLFIVASKSGGTTETLSHLAFFWDKVPNGTQFVAITDPGTSLETLARERGFRAVFVNPDDIGGRYSALSYFGLVPAALIGAPLHEVLDRAEEMQTASERTIPAAQSPGATLGAMMGESAKAGRDKLTIALPEEIASFGSWVEQLIAESTGKEDVGVVPVVGEPLGAPDVYGQDRVFVAIGEHGGLDELENVGHPVVRSPYDGREQIGGEFFRWEMATAIAGYVLGINPFDQPNVQEAKDATKAILASGSVEDPGFDDLGVLLKQVGEGDYVAILAYLDRTSETEDAIERVRLAIRDRYRVATTTGFGPRFLHSTGQLHKGGAEQRRVHPGGGCRTFRRPADPRPALLVRNADRRAGARRPAVAPRARAARRPRDARTTDGGGLMQLGMVGLGRMGANLTRRLMRGGHEVVVYDVNADSVSQLESEGSIGTGSLEDFVSKLSKPRAAWVMVPAAFAEQTTDALAELMEAGDVVIDGGNSYYRDDVDRAERYGEKGVHFVDVGTSGGVFGLERGFCLMIGGEDEIVRRLDPIFATIAPGVGSAERTPGRTDANSDDRGGRVPALRPAGCGALREDGPQRHRVRAHGGVRRGSERAQARGGRRRRARGRRRDHSAARSEVLPLRPRHPRDRGGVATRERRGVVAAGPHGRGDVRGPGAGGVRGAGERFGRGSVDGAGGGGRGRAGARALGGAVRPVRVARRGRLREQDPVGDAQAVRGPRREGGVVRIRAR